MDALPHRFGWWLHYVAFDGMALGDVALWFQVAVLFGQGLILFFSARYALSAIKEAKSARDLQSTTALINELGSEEVREARRWVLEVLDENGSARFMTDDGLKKARRVAVALDRVAFMVMQKLTPEDPFLDWQREEIAGFWRRLKPIIEQERGKPGRGGYCHQFEKLAEEWLPKTEAKYRRHSIPAAKRCPACDGKGMIFESSHRS